MSRAFLARVARVERLTESFARITLTGDELQHFGSGGYDQRTKLLFPHRDGSWGDFGLFEDPPLGMNGWYRRWRLLPCKERNTMRTYTVRAVRPETAEVDVDFVLHGTAGPASAWATSVTAGDEVAIIGPDSRQTAVPNGGVEWRPGSATRVLLAGDETAAPAICAILEALPEHIGGTALVEVPTVADRLPVESRSAVEIRWLAREGAAHGSRLVPAVEEWGRTRAEAGHGSVALPEPGPDEILWDAPPEAQRSEYAWLAGEAGVITGLRRHLVRDLGIDRSSVAFMGYWRQGRSEN